MLAGFSGESRVWLLLCSVTMTIFIPGALKGIVHIFVGLMVKSLDLLASDPPLLKASLSLKHLFSLHMVSLSLPDVKGLLCPHSSMKSGLAQ